MRPSELHNYLINNYVKKNCTVSFSNEGIEVLVYYNGVNNLDVLNEIKKYVEELGFETKKIGKKYRKLLILC